MCLSTDLTNKPTTVLIREWKDLEDKYNEPKPDPEQYLQECIFYSDDVLEWAERIADAKRDLTIYVKEMQKRGFPVKNP